MRPVDLATLVVLGALWGGSYLFIRVGAPAFGPLPFMAGRVAIAGLVRFAVLHAIGYRVALRPHARRLLVLGLLNAALPFTLIATAELRLTASLVAVLGATAPVFTALLGVIWLNERVSVSRGTGLLIGVIGVAILTGWSPIPLNSATALSILVTLVATLSYAAAGIYSKRALSGIPVPTLALGQQVAALAWLAIPAAAQVPSIRPNLGAVAALAALALLSTALAYVLYFRLIARVGPTLTSRVTYIAPVFGMLGGAHFLGERSTRGMLVGFACVALSIALVNDGWLDRFARVLRLARAAFDFRGHDQSRPTSPCPGPLTSSSVELVDSGQARLRLG